MTPTIPDVPTDLIAPVRSLVLAASNLSRLLAIVLEDTALTVGDLPNCVHENAELIKMGESVISAWKLHLAIDVEDASE